MNIQRLFRHILVAPWWPFCANSRSIAPLENVVFVPPTNCLLLFQSLLLLLLLCADNKNKNNRQNKYFKGYLKYLFPGLHFSFEFYLKEFNYGYLAFCLYSPRTPILSVVCHLYFFLSAYLTVQFSS